MSGKESDSEWLAKNYVDEEWLKLHDSVSRFAVINKDGTLTKTDNWVKDVDGREWSNSGYTPYTSYYGSRRWNEWLTDKDEYPYVANECATYGVKRNSYTYPSINGAALVKVLEQIMPDKDMLNAAIDYVKNKPAYVIDDSLRVKGKVVNNLTYTDNGEIVDMNENSDTHLGLLSPKQIKSIASKIEMYLSEPLTKDGLFFDNDLGSNIAVGIDIVAAKTYISRGTGLDASNLLADLEYRLNFFDYGGINNQIVLEAPLSNETFALGSFDQGTFDLETTVALAVVDELLTRQLDDDYYDALSEEGGLDTTHRLTIKR